MKYNIRFKGIWLLILLVTGLTTASFAQLSKMQFEDAELAFSEGKFADAIVLLDAAEKSNKGVNPPIIHLRILCRVELIKMNPERNFDIIDKARKETGFFLKEYERDASLEEKYREVYKASKVLKDLPLTQAEFDEAIRVKKEAVAKAEATRKEKMRYFLSYDYIKGFRWGYALEEFKKEKRLKDKHIPQWPNGDRKFYDNSVTPEYYFVFRKGKAIGYETSEEWDDNATHEKGHRILLKKVAAFNDRFGFEPIVENVQYSDSTITGTKYTWKSGNKTFIVRSLFYKFSTAYISDIIYCNYDESYL